MGKIVKEAGDQRAAGLFHGEVCKRCPGGCKTDCQRSGVNVNYDRSLSAESYDFSNMDTSYYDDDNFVPEYGDPDWDPTMG